MIPATGAGGETGQAIIWALVARGARVRAFVRRMAHGASLAAMGAREVIAGPMDDPHAWSRAVRGTDAIYHICPNVSPDEIVFAKALFAAATELGVPRLVYHSVLPPQIDAMPHHWNTLGVQRVRL